MAEHDAPRLGLIVAMARGGAIGRDGGLPWRLPDDLAHFKKTTLGHCLIMGRKTWESLPGALPGRTSIVVTRRGGQQFEGAEAASSVDAAVAIAAGLGDPEPIVAGGAEIYALALPRVARMWLTRVHAEVEGDTFFPEWGRGGVGARLRDRAADRPAPRSTPSRSRNGSGATEPEPRAPRSARFADAFSARPPSDRFCHRPCRCSNHPRRVPTLVWCRGVGWGEHR